MKDTGQYIFSDEDLQQSLHKVDDIACDIGFLTTIHTQYALAPDGRNDYQFFHLSFQEYMASRAIAKAASSDDGWKKVVKCIRHLGVGESTHLLWIFAAGEMDISQLPGFLRSLESSVTLGPLQAQHMRVLILQCLAEKAYVVGGDHPYSLEGAVKNILRESTPFLSNIVLTPDHCNVISQALQLAEHITDLTLHNCGLTAQHCHMLASSEAILRVRTVDVQRNIGLRGEGLRKLVRTLKTSCNLYYFNVYACKLWSDDGRSLSTLLQHSQSLQNLDCRGNDFGEGGIVALSQGIKSSKSLQGIRVGKNASSFKTPSSMLHFCNALKRHKTLKRVQVDLCALADSSAEQIFQAGQGLERLELQLNNFTDDIVDLVRSFLSSLNSQSLNFRSTSRLASKWFKPYASVLMSSICASVLPTQGVHVDLSGNRITRAGIEQLRTSLPQPNVHTVSFGYCRLQGEKCKLQSVPFCKCHSTTGDQAVEAMLNLDGKSSVSYHESQDLDLTHRGISDNGAEILAECLQLSCPIRSLDLMANNITDEGVHALAEGLMNNTTLLALDLTGNRVTTKGVNILLDSLSQCNHCLQHLNLDDNLLFTDHSKNCCTDYERTIKRLLTSSQLEFVGLRGNGITTAELRHVTSSLQTNSSLLGINLSENSVGNEGARLLSNVLRINKTLRLVQLVNTAIGDEGAQLLAAVLSSSGRSSTTIFLGDNPVSSDLFVPGMVEGALWYHGAGELLDILKV